MKRERVDLIATLIVLLIVCLLLARGCDYFAMKSYDPPYGIWKCDDLNMTIYVDPKYYIPEIGRIYSGIYNLNNKEKKVIVGFAGYAPEISIWDINNFDIERGVLNASHYYYRWIYEIKDNELHCSSHNHRYEYVFYKLEEYEEIYPSEWLPSNPDENIEDENEIESNNE